MSSTSGRSQLHSLARLKGLQTSFFDVHGQRRRTNDETLVSLLGSLGVDASSPEACLQSLRSSTRRYWESILEPVVVAWDGLMPRFEVRTRASESSTPRVEIETENGDVKAFHAWDINIDGEPGSRIDGTEFRKLRVNTGERLPTGYHTLRVTSGARSAEATIISAPRQCFNDSDGQSREWGLFAPAYALRGPRDIGSGNYGDLAELSAWTASLGGTFVGTLPLLPIDMQAPEQSPYLPLTRLFWSDFYIDLNSIPFLHTCPELPSLMEGVTRLPAAKESAEHLVDYRKVHTLKRRVLAAMWGHLRDSHDGVLAELQNFLQANPDVADFARYRFARETYSGNRQGQSSVATAQTGVDVGYYEFVQWLADRQMRDWSQSEAGPYLDLPIGVHPDGYDAQRYGTCFLRDASCGAPPDSVFTTGQDWGAPPLNPETIREDGYAYLRACLSHHMRFSRILRIDHVMGLHRMYCVPKEMEASNGTYLRYRSEELYAVVSVESNRHRTTVVGEDLGTVPRHVPRAMRRHGVNRMFVLYYELDRISRGEMPRTPADAMASINTHDMPTIASTWNGLDIRQQLELGILSADKEKESLDRRARAKEQIMALLRAAVEGNKTDLTGVMTSLIAWLGRSRARYVMASVEDLVLATEQPNIPGVGTRRPNWRFRLQYDLPELRENTDVATALRALDSARQGPEGHGGQTHE